MPDETLAPRSERYYPDRVIGARVITYAQVDSTMNVARALADAGAAPHGPAPHGTVVRAHVQRVGRGRFARRWESAVGDSLLTSTILRMPPLPIAAPISVAATLAVRDTVRELTSSNCAIKWPNDVHVGGRKIAGVLVEASVDTAGAGVAVLGIGLNVNFDPAKFADISEIATSLAVGAGHRFALDAVEATLFAKLDATIAQMIENPQQTIADWRTSLDTLGHEITVHTRTGALVGIAEDVDEQGQLLLRTPDGKLHTLAEGDVSLRA
jgi:BirA family biotin operon repressor/biotin-[acetyl-CoA-carboxylase] ligase